MSLDSGGISASVAAVLSSPEGRRKVAALIRDTRLVLKREPAINALRRTIRARPELRFYLNVGRARTASAAVAVSVRFKGLEIGKVEIRAGRRSYVPPHSEAILRHYDGWGFPGNSLDGLEWGDEKITRLYKSIVSGWNELELHSSLEHEIESKLIEELAAPGRRKTGGFRGMRPVFVGGYPFQFGIPLSPSDGRVILSGKNARGHVDILARSNEGGRTSLAVLELKKPGSPDNALFQAFVYACGLRHIMNANKRTAGVFMRHFGFKRTWPVSIRAVAVVDVGDITRAKRAWAGIMKDPVVASGEITPHVIGYRYVGGRLTLESGRQE